MQDDPTVMYNPDAVVQRANEKFNSEDVAGAQNIYQTEIFAWVDDATFGDGDPLTLKQIANGVATLWIEYANLNRRARLFKAATEAFEQAANCPVAKSVMRVWKEYANFQQERNRNKTAQKIYIRALVGEGGSPAAVVDPGDQEELWLAFLDMMKRLNNDSGLTLQQLKSAVQVEQHTLTQAHGQETLTQIPIKDELGSEPVPMETPQIGIEVEAQQPAAKRIKVVDTAVSSAPYMTNIRAAISAQDVEVSAVELLGSTKSMPAEITAEWLARDGNAFPSRPERPLFSPSPPKLRDTSGRDLLGTELAMKLTRLLISDSDNDFTGTAILEICKGCWMMTALKEREATKCIEALDKKLTEDISKLEATLEARLSVAGPALVAVQQINANERAGFIAACNQQRQQLQAMIAWEFRHLLAIQQQILHSAGVPGFDGATVDAKSIYIQSSICSFLHSAFYLRSQIGEKQHLTMLKSKEASLALEQSVPMPLPPELNQQQSLVNVPGYNYPPPPPPPQFTQQGVYNTVQHGQVPQYH